LNSFRYPRAVSIALYVASIVLFGSFVSEFMTNGFSVRNVTVSLLFLVLFIVAQNESSTIVTSDEEKIIIRRWSNTMSLRWSEIDDVQSSPRFIAIRSIKRGKAFKAFKGEYGLSLEPFDVLQNEIIERSKNILENTWKRLSLPLTFRCSKSSVGLFAIYMIPLGLILYVEFLIAMTIDGYLLEKILFFVVSIAVLIPIFIRDMRRSRKTLILEDEGLRQINGRDYFIPWEAVEKIVIKDAPLGYGSVNIVSRDGKIFRFSRSIISCGAILSVIGRKTGLSETYSYEL